MSMASVAAEAVEVELDHSRQRSILVALAFCFALIPARAADAQGQEPSPWFTRVGFTPAYVFATNPFSLNGAPADREIRATPSMTIEIGRQTDGTREWHDVYGLPSYGIGFSVASLGNGDGTTRPVDGYAFFSWPFARLNDRVQVTTDFGMGVSWNWKAFNRHTNSYTTVLGSNMNARIDWGFYLRYIATPQTSLYAGIDYTHRSNGGMVQPDQGINVIGPSVALRYNLTPERYQLSAKEPPPFRPAWEFVIGGAGGLKNVVVKSNPDLRQDFGAFDGTIGLQRHFYRYGKIASGAEVTYDGAAARLASVTNGRDTMAIGVYGGYEHVIGRFSALVQVGYNVANGSPELNRPRFYERYGWRYQFNDHYWGTFAVRAIEGWKADFLEFGAGYKTRW